ncbi:hypothetical protein IJU22_01435 [Candidatus Saccharibacteria bacterium]|nr:hypothetical protein [Candidatus Saccharibacteria bacterium]
MASESGATVIQGTVGTWWSQGARSNTYARDLALLGNYTGPENNNYKTIGYSVRCVAQLFRRPRLHPRQ